MHFLLKLRPLLKNSFSVEIYAAIKSRTGRAEFCDRCVVSQTGIFKIGGAGGRVVGAGDVSKRGGGEMQRGAENITFHFQIVKTSIHL